MVTVREAKRKNTTVTDRCLEREGEQHLEGCAEGPVVSSPNQSGMQLEGSINALATVDSFSATLNVKMLPYQCLIFIQCLIERQIIFTLVDFFLKG